MYIGYYQILLACVMLSSSVDAASFNWLDETFDDTTPEKVEAGSLTLTDNRRLRIFIKSEGCNDAGISGCGHATIIVNGKDHALKKRGYNVVVVDAQTGNVVKSAVYDTHASKANAVALAAFLNQYSGKRRIILVAIQDEASLRMDNGGYSSLEKIGAENIEKGYRSSLALIGWSGPGKTNFVTQVQSPRYKGPSIISKVLYSPIY